jgi:hypothetical protein
MQDRLAQTEVIFRHPGLQFFQCDVPILLVKFGLQEASDHQLRGSLGLLIQVTLSYEDGVELVLTISQHIAL